jgi:hypothetical protein
MRASRKPEDRSICVAWCGAISTRSSNLLIDKRGAHEAGTHDIDADAVLGSFLGDDAGQTEQPVLGGDIGRFQFRRFF